jgi:hypothetical protein
VLVKLPELIMSLLNTYGLVTHPIVFVLLCRLFNLILKHGYVPSDFGRGIIIIPIVRDKCGNVCDADNYRGITVSPIITSIFESCILCKYKHLLTDDELQFRFKKHIGCGPAVFCLQQLVNYFSRRRSCVYITSVDAIKAFDRVDHYVLFSKIGTASQMEWNLK